MKKRNQVFVAGVIALLLLQLVFICGCVEKQDIQGVYRNNDKAIFFHDGGVYHSSEKQNNSGRWFERKGYVYLDDDTLHVIVWTTDGRDLIDPEGNRWVKDD